eukprot:scaffold13625_cov112-Isochrysis_galbana.AAC.3
MAAKAASERERPPRRATFTSRTVAADRELNEWREAATVHLCTSPEHDWSEATAQFCKASVGEVFVGPTGLVSLRTLDGLDVGVGKLRPASNKRARANKCNKGKKFPQVVLERRAGKHEPALAAQAVEQDVGFRLRVLQALTLVEDEQLKRERRQQLYRLVSNRKVVGRK